MKSFLTAATLLAALACGAEPVEAGKASGIVLDRDGNPIAGVKITVENTVFYASYVFGKTDSAGRYKLDVPSGSWKVHAEIVRPFHGREFFFDLAPDDPEPFAGTEGATRNFTWRIDGTRPELPGGFYGGQVTVMHGGLDYSFEPKDLEVTLTPDGPLIDGSAGRVVTGTPAEGSDLIDDVPVGQYTVTVRHKTRGPMSVRVRNAGELGPRATVLFKSPFPESSRYGIEIEVKSPEE